MKGYPIPGERLLHILPALSYTPSWKFSRFHAYFSPCKKKTPKNTGQIKGLDIGMG
jgi:hypothetical protein